MFRSKNNQTRIKDSLWMVWMQIEEPIRLNVQINSDQHTSRWEHCFRCKCGLCYCYFGVYLDGLISWEQLFVVMLLFVFDAIIMWQLGFAFACNAYDALVVVCKTPLLFWHFSRSTKCPSYLYLLFVENDLFALELIIYYVFLADNQLNFNSKHIILIWMLVFKIRFSFGKNAKEQQQNAIPKLIFLHDALDKQIN